ncbi:SDR family NAD(P)-dependent oxidoreductase [Lysinibacillus sp. NPDC097195]|uniref:SDR family NAD(P)-dependent oxidoreductase n=1 Tax=Lysinibacillus sp. NPDC097195 TaxID=3364141 RepID=UPI00380BA20C
MLLSGKVAVITGCNRGIGKAITTVFAKQGANIIACARKSTVEFESYLTNLQNETGVQITPVYFDISKEDEVKLAIKEIRKLSPTIDILVNNAGIAGDTIYQMTAMETLEEKMKVNFYGPFLMTQYIVKLMRKSTAASIVNITSIAADDSYKGMISYTASKAAFNAFTKTIANELGSANIRVNAIAPGFTETDMVSNAVTSEEFLTQLQSHLALKRLARPEEIANSVLFLASDLSSYITGQILRVDGGLFND